MERFWNRAARDKDKIRYQQAKSYSPYSEFFGGWVEEKQGLTYLTFNAFYRFDDIMEALYEETPIRTEHRNLLFDLYVHYLIELEFRTGLTQREYDVHDAMKRMEAGEYGETAAELFSSLSAKEKYYVAHMMLHQERTGASVEKYVDVLTALLENSIAYKNRFHPKELLLYVGNRENERDQKKILLINELFQPLGYCLKVFWDKHFAVLNEKQTMEIGKIELL